MHWFPIQTIIEAPNVVYLEDGSIDGANSTVRIQDQRAGGETFYEHKIDGHTVYLSGRIDATYTFDKLLEEDYIPVTTKEFRGLKDYEKATVTVDTEDSLALYKVCFKNAKKRILISDHSKLHKRRKYNACNTKDADDIIML